MLKQFTLVAMGLCFAIAGCCALTHKPKDHIYMVPKPAMVSPEEWGSKPQPIPDSSKHTPQFITIHHEGVDWKPGRDPVEKVRAVQKYGQNEKNWPDLPYHFMIAPDGRIFVGRPTIYEPQSNTKYELQGHIGVELMGNFENQRPSPAQLKSTVALVAWLCDDLKVSPDQIGGHRDRAETTCPGRDLYRYIESGQFKTWVKQTLAGEIPDVEPGPPLDAGPTAVIDTPVATAPTTQTQAK